MHLPSKINPRYISILALILFLAILPLKNTVQNILIFFSRGLLITPIGLSRQLQKTKEKNLSLTLKIRDMQYMKEENIKLKKALSFKEEKGINIIGVDIVSFDPSNWRKVVVVNAGENDGIIRGFYAVDENGWLIGKVVETRSNYSRIVLIDDPDFAMPVFVEDKSYGLLKGSLAGVKILYVEKDEDIKEKDKVWCKIPSLNFPLYIGEVKGITRNEDNLFKDVEVNIFSKNPLFHKIFIVR